MGDTSRSQTVSTRLQQIAKQAEDYPQMVFTTLAHHLDVDLLREAYRHTRKNSSPGVDGITAKQYGEHLVERLGSDQGNRLILLGNGTIKELF